jgi:signal transduction histidine kinase
MILLDNALKHTPEGGRVMISAKLHGSRVDLRVHDSGSGIAPEDLPHVFDRFYRADRARTEQDGSGLGLAIGRWIAEAHGGHISAGNAPEGGAAFAVTLPFIS